MRYLLDTHVLLWWLRNDARLARSIAAAIAEPQNEICVSAVTAWEIVLKVGLGRLDFPVDELSEQIEGNDFVALPVTVQHAQALQALPVLHRDPFDRMLIAQARVEQLALLTQDDVILSYPGVLATR